MTDSSKLYIIVREDLAVGLQAAQACHALREFAEDYPKLDRDWFENSKTLVLLNVPDELSLYELAEKAEGKGIECVLNKEPDLDDQATSLALGPGAKSLVRPLQLLG